MHNLLAVDLRVIGPAPLYNCSLASLRSGPSAVHCLNQVTAGTESNQLDQAKKQTPVQRDSSIATATKPFLNKTCARALMLLLSQALDSSRSSLRKARLILNGTGNTRTIRKTLANKNVLFPHDAQKSFCRLVTSSSFAFQGLGDTAPAA